MTDRSEAWGLLPCRVLDAGTSREFVRKRSCDRRLVGESLLSVFGEFIAADGDRLCRRGERVPDDGVVLACHEQDAHGRLMLVMDAQTVVDEGNVETELTGIARVKVGGLEFDDDVAQLLNVEEQQIDVEVVPIDVEMHLSANERESGAEFTHRVEDSIDHALLEFAFGGVAADGEELERVRILGEFLRLVGIQPLKGAGKVAGRCGLPLVQPRHDLVGEHRPTPPMVCVFGGVPVAQLLVVQLVEQLDDVTPRQFSNGSLENCIEFRPRFGEAAHVLQIRWREALHGGELIAQISREPRNHTGTPRFLGAPDADDLTDTPPQLQQLIIGFALHAQARAVYLLLEVFERGGIIVGHEVCRHELNRMREVVLTQRPSSVRCTRGDRDRFGRALAL